MASQQQNQSGSPPSAQLIGNAFVQQYYHILHSSPDLVHRFYQETSKLGRPEANGVMASVTSTEAINNKIMSMEVTKAEIDTVDAQDSLRGGVIVLVTGHLTGRHIGVRREFTQTFFLAPQNKGYFVLNDLFRYTSASVIPVAEHHDPSDTPHVHVPVEVLANGTAVHYPSEHDGHSIYVKNLPLNATPQQLEYEFKKYGAIRPGSIQVRSNKAQGFCYGFVEFKEASAIQSAVEASPFTIDGRQCFVEEKRASGSRGGGGRGRFGGRGGSGVPSFWSEGPRGGRGGVAMAVAGTGAVMAVAETSEVATVGLVGAMITRRSTVP